MGLCWSRTNCESALRKKSCVALVLRMQRQREGERGKERKERREEEESREQRKGERANFLPLDPSF